MRTLRFTTVLMGATLYATIGCSSGKSKTYVPALNASSLASTNDPTQTFVLSGNSLRVLQDKQISFAPGGGATGTYAVTGLPAWATFDTTTGTVSGVARVAADGGGTITITKTDSGTNTTYGPYQVVIVGDVMKEQQWHLINSGQTGYAYAAGTAGQDIQQKAAVNANVFGTGVRIAISDSGTLVAHPDLQPNNLAAENRSYFNNFAATNSWLGDPTPPFGDDDNAHGTAVAGLAAAKGWNGIGGRGVASEAKFAAFEYIPAQQVLASRGLSDQGFLDQFAGNFDVFNYSWGDSQCVLTEYASTLAAKLTYGVTSQRANKGSVFVAAAGNDYVANLSDCYPNVSTGYVYGNANFSESLTTPYQIAVGAVTADGTSTSYSSPGSAIWVSAPGGEFGYSHTVTGASEASEPALVTTDFVGCTAGLKNIGRADSVFDAGGAPNTDCAYTNTMNGTSGASPLVTGVVALILQIRPDLTWREIKYILATTADRVDPARTQNTQPGGVAFTGHVYELPWTRNNAGHYFHNWYGFGRVNADNALAAARLFSSGSLNTFGDSGWIDSGTLNLTVPTGTAGLTQTLTAPARTIEAVQVRASVTGCVGDVGLELTSAKGTLSYLMNVNSGLRDTSISDHTFLTNAFLDEAAAGTWTLRVVEGKASGCSPVLTNWKLKIFGH